jgi:hypothetical protein
MLSKITKDRAKSQMTDEMTLAHKITKITKLYSKMTDKND